MAAVQGSLRRKSSKEHACNTGRRRRGARNSTVAGRVLSTSRPSQRRFSHLRRCGQFFVWRMFVGFTTPHAYLQPADAAAFMMFDACRGSPPFFRGAGGCEVSPPHMQGRCCWLAVDEMITVNRWLQCDVDAQLVLFLVVYPEQLLPCTLSNCCERQCYGQ